MRSTIIATLIAIAAFSTVGSATAGPSSRAKAAAEWARGKQLLSQKRTEEAIESLERAVSSEPLPQYRLDLARALMAGGAFEDARQIVSALAADTERAHVQTTHAARRLDQELARRTPTLTVEAADDGEVLANGRVIEKGKPVSLDPGSYRVELRRDGEVVAKRRVILSEGEHEELQLEHATREARDQAAPREAGNWWPAGVSFALGGAGLTAGAVVGVLAFDATRELEAACENGTCPPDQARALEEARALSHGSTAAFCAGGVGVALGVIFSVTLGTKGKAAPVSPYVGLGDVGVRGAF